MRWSIFRIHADFLGAAKGRFFFHPSDQNPSLGTPERKKPLERVLSVYINSGRRLSILLLQSASRRSEGSCEHQWIPQGLKPNPLYGFLRHD
jgi:hypothetical protein